MAPVENLWAPWRLEYVRGERPDGCVLCAKHAETDDAEALVLARGEHAYVVLNLYPYNPGHLMVVPYRHVAGLEQLTADESREAQELLATAIRTIRGAMTPGGFNVGLNLGSAAGAGIPDHLHWQLVPRWEGDVNFMPLLADVRVMPQHMQTTWRQLRDAWGTFDESDGEDDGV
ncbi:MAG: family hydrolase [Thermoleophilia bacterium]|nr:family hydrolase [Thermoleophilia bacterium]